MATEETCPECGAVVADGRAGCQALYDALAFEALENRYIAAVHNLAFDTYCMQHVETYCVSAKSYVAHLTRLCVGLEYSGLSEVYDALQRWYHGGLVKPPVLSRRGDTHITDVQALTNAPAKIYAIRAWALDVWSAYSSQHALARTWVEEALAARHKR